MATGTTKVYNNKTGKSETVNNQYLQGYKNSGWSTTKNAPAPVTPSNPANLKYGDTMTDSAGRTGVVKYDYKTGKALTPPSTTPTAPAPSTGGAYDPTLTSDKYRSSVSALDKKISEYAKNLKQQNDEDIAGITAAYEQARLIQGQRQEKDYAGRSTGLVTSGGGFLGATQSQQGVLQNLSNEFEQEKQALMSKRDAAIRASRDAYSSKAFALAIQQLNLAKDAEQQLYDRQKDYAEQQLALSRENRAQSEYERGVSQDKIKAYAAMSDEEFKNVDTSLTDTGFYSGYTRDQRKLLKQEQEIKSKKDMVSLDSNILDMRLKIPAGRKFELGGVTYTGLKQADGGSTTQAERDKMFMDKISMLFSPGTIVPESGQNRIPILDANGYATPEGWKSVMKASGLNRVDFIKQFGNYIAPTGIEQYGLTNVERELILGKL